MNSKPLLKDAEFPAGQVTPSRGGSAFGRSHSIDALRGLVMVLMVLDHVRDFFSNTGLNPTNIQEVTVGVFLTRWVSHLCAPVFIFLAGAAASLNLAQGRKVEELASFLWKRGVWLLLLEWTVIRLGWMMDLNYQLTQLQVFWAIGWSMIFLSFLVYLPVRLVAWIGAVIVFGHNLLDPIRSESFGYLGWLWKILHEPGYIVSSSSFSVDVLYPLFPWIGVIALGFAFGHVWQRIGTGRPRFAFLLGWACLSVFTSLRFLNLYGEPTPWELQPDVLHTVLSFVNYQKYPPSLDFLLANMGFAFLLLGAMEMFPKFQPKALLVYGRVPLFFYLSHLFLIHFLAIAVAFTIYGHFPSKNLTISPPIDWGFSLPVVYGVWAAVVFALYPLCRWYADFKKRAVHPFWRYL